MSQKHPHLGTFALLPVALEKCPECAVEHTPEEPHNQQSLTWQYSFFGRIGRWPTWADAMAHCSEPIQAAWRSELSKAGVQI
jgi:hypothetical protein